METKEPEGEAMKTPDRAGWYWFEQDDPRIVFVVAVWNNGRYFVGSYAAQRQNGSTYVAQLPVADMQGRWGERLEEPKF
jgi:hypothetical protein